MPDSTLQDAIREAYASAPADEVVLHTLEIRHPAFIDDAGAAVAIRVVADMEDFVGTLEAGAPLNGGETVTFTAFAFDFKLPDIDDGGLPQITITMDNVGRVLMQHLEAAALSTQVAHVTYRPYLASDPTAPQMDPPLTMELVAISCDAFRVQATAQFKLMHNIRFPRDSYTIDAYPSLRS